MSELLRLTNGSTCQWKDDRIQALCKGPLWAGYSIAEEPADVERKVNRIAGPWKISELAGYSDYEHGQLARHDLDTSRRAASWS
jgi:hypothetical protein